MRERKEVERGGEEKGGRERREGERGGCQREKGREKGREREKGKREEEGKTTRIDCKYYTHAHYS